MKEQILELIELKPKHFSILVKNSPEMRQWVIDNSPIRSDNMAEMIYCALNDVDNVCVHNNIKKFNSVNLGYRFCGPAGTCACAAKSVSEKVANCKNKYTIEQQQLINQRRLSTSMRKYGVTNNAQTGAARELHKNYYATQVRKLRPIKLTPYEKLNKKYKCMANIEFVTPELMYQGVSNQVYYRFNCLTCNAKFDDYVDNGHLPCCKMCNPYQAVYTSKQETAVYEYVKSIVNSPVQQSNKTIINPFELDIVIPDLKIAIEYCGLYWHSEAQKSNQNYHINKLTLCAQQGYRLITIFQDEWIHHPEIVKSRLSSILGTDTVIYARKCRVGMISIAEAKSFVSQHHIQGWAISSTAYGCFYNNQLVAVMTFGSPRYDKTSQYELIRFCSIGTVVGGAGRLFLAFCRQYNPTSVVSYCDMRWGTGNLYKKLNFVQVSGGKKPSYSYTDFVKRFHRSGFSKKHIVKNQDDMQKTEHQIMRERNMYRIWDCGQTKWVYTNAQVQSQILATVDT